MTFLIDNNYYGFKLVDTWTITEADSTAFLFEHLKSKARLLYLQNTDDNKVFCISFRTPPNNDTGTPHILEHSVLCGSDKYPLKEPFVELVKSTLNTFLNAMTYPDKTMYPVASKNEADLKNLIDVYCDAVFNPNIKKDKSIFLQEGWHHHLESKDDEIYVNGVVYNEMKGVFSDPEEVISRNIQMSLYKDTPYAKESGGDPDSIPELTYEEFINFYNTYYHPSNSYIYIYGDMQIDKYLIDLDEKYLSNYDAKIVNSLPALQAPFSEPVNLEFTYPVEADFENNSKDYFAANFKIGEASETALSYKFNVLTKALFDSDASILKKALIDAHIADEIDYYYTTAVREPYFSIIAKNAEHNKYQLFIDTITNTLKDIVANGIDEEIIISSLNNYEFELKEADSGSHPKGLIFGIEIMESWLYDAKPGIHLEYTKHLEELRNNVTSKYYTDMICTYLLDNNHKSYIRLSPEIGGTERHADNETKLMANLKSSLSEAEIDALVNQTQDLLLKQHSQDTQEAKDTISVLPLSEIKQTPDRCEYDLIDIDDKKIISYTDNCRDIVYTDIHFDFTPSSTEEISLLSLLASVLGVYKTEKYSELDLLNVLSMYLGNLNTNIQSYQNYSDLDSYEKKFILSAKALSQNTDKIFELAKEILLNTIIDDPQRLYKTIREELSKFDSKLLNSAHTLMIARINTQTTQRGQFSDYSSGIEYYKFLKNTKIEIENNNHIILSKLNDIYKKIINCYKCNILVTTDKENKKLAISRATEFLKDMPSTMIEYNKFLFNMNTPQNEGIIIPSKVSYVAMGYNYKILGYEFNSALALIKKHLSTNFLWDKIRIVGGAYGAMVALDSYGTLSFVSYRDPNVKSTIETYKQIPNEIANLQLNDKDIQKLIIGAISDIDTPLPVYTKGRVCFNEIYKNVTYAEKCKNRADLLSLDINKLKDTANLFENFINNSIICAASSKNKLDENMEYFNEIYSI